MQEQTYAVVVYLHGPLAQVVNRLREQLNPEYAGKSAHVTVLPPRPLVISEEAATEEARAQCTGWEPFELAFGSVQTFLPVNGVVYLGLEQGTEQMRHLHQTLNRGYLACKEPLEYIPHIAIAQDLTEQRILDVFASISSEFAAYRGPRRHLVTALTFVRQSASGDWIDLAELQLGRASVLTR